MWHHTIQKNPSSGTKFVLSHGQKPKLPFNLLKGNSNPSNYDRVNLKDGGKNIVDLFIKKFVYRYIYR